MCPATASAAAASEAAARLSVIRPAAHDQRTRRLPELYGLRNDRERVGSRTNRSGATAPPAEADLHRRHQRRTNRALSFDPKADGPSLQAGVLPPFPSIALQTTPDASAWVLGKSITNICSFYFQKSEPKRHIRRTINEVLARKAQAKLNHRVSLHETTTAKITRTNECFCHIKFMIVFTLAAPSVAWLRFRSRRAKVAPPQIS